MCACLRLISAGLARIADWRAGREVIQAELCRNCNNHRLKNSRSGRKRNKGRPAFPVCAGQRPIGRGAAADFRQARPAPKSVDSCGAFRRDSRDSAAIGKQSFCEFCRRCKAALDLAEEVFVIAVIIGPAPHEAAEGYVCESRNTVTLLPCGGGIVGIERTRCKRRARRG